MQLLLCSSVHGGPPPPAPSPTPFPSPYSTQSLTSALELGLGGEQLACRLDGLLHLKLRGTPISAQDLAALGRTCPQLQRLVLQAAGTCAAPALRPSRRPPKVPPQ